MFQPGSWEAETEVTSEQRLDRLERIAELLARPDPRDRQRRLEQAEKIEIIIAAQKEQAERMASRIMKATRVLVNESSLTVGLADGRTISVPLAWYPRLLHGKTDERNNWQLVAHGEGIHWPDLDEGVSVENLLRGKRSAESASAFQRWLRARSA